MRQRAFADRREAGEMLARKLEGRLLDDAVVIGLARGGVAVAAEVAALLRLPLDALAVRQVGHPLQPECAIGAVTSGDGVYVRSREDLTEEAVGEAVAAARTQAEELDRRLHAGRARLPVAGKTCLLVDDGLATGATMTAAVRWARSQGATRILAAVPVGAEDTVAALKPEVELLVCLETPVELWAISFWYEDFAQVSDDEVISLLEHSGARLVRREPTTALPTKGRTPHRDLVLPSRAGGRRLRSERETRPSAQREWNVVATSYHAAFGRARSILRRFGLVQRSQFRNVLLIEVEDVDCFLADFAELAEKDPNVLTAVARVVPAHHTFHFDLPEQFEEQARRLALGWLGDLAGKSFHVRLHRRGFKGRLSSPEEERFLDGTLLRALEAAGTPGSITFDDPDAIIDVEIVGNWAGMSLWAREDLERYPFLKLD